MYSLKLKSEEVKEDVLKELRSSIFHVNISDSSDLWIDWDIHNCRAEEVLDHLKYNFLIDTWIKN